MEEKKRGALLQVHRGWRGDVVGHLLITEGLKRPQLCGQPTNSDRADEDGPGLLRMSFSVLLARSVNTYLRQHGRSDVPRKSIRTYIGMRIGHIEFPMYGIVFLHYPASYILANMILFVGGQITRGHVGWPCAFPSLFMSSSPFLEPFKGLGVRHAGVRFDGHAREDLLDSHLDPR